MTGHRPPPGAGTGVGVATLLLMVLGMFPVMGHGVLLADMERDGVTDFGMHLHAHMHTYTHTHIHTYTHTHIHTYTHTHIHTYTHGRVRAGGWRGRGGEWMK